jgi:hypothetical protein
VYLFIKQNDVKTFKSFLKGKEIEVGVVISATANMFFGKGDEVEIFYGDQCSDPYKAHITRHNKKVTDQSQSVVMLGLVKR